MNHKRTIGGRAYVNGVRLMDGKMTVKTYYDKRNRLQVEMRRAKRSKFLLLMKKIPVLRGIASIIVALAMFIKESTGNPRKYWFIFVIIAADILFFLLPPGEGATSAIFMGIYYLLPVILLIIFRDKIREALKYHGAEHKAVNYFENDYQGDIASYSRLHRRCGSNLVFYYILIRFLPGFNHIPLNYFIRELLYIGIAYELVKYTPEKLMVITTLLQRLVTSEPEQRHMIAARRALEVLTGKG